MIANNTITGSFDCYVLADEDRNILMGQARESKSSIARLKIEDLVNRIEQPPIRAIVGSVFQDLLRLLECLDLIQSHVRQVDKADETLALFQLIHSEAQSLISSVKTEAVAAEQIDGNLAETLDGISFAVEHDLKRVFDSPFESQSSDERQHMLIGKLMRSYDLLTNCLQQSTLTLAAIFDSSFTDSKLFTNFDERLRESLQLCADLTELLQCVEHTEQQLDRDGCTGLVPALFKFRAESMQYLAYSDWPEFEGFCERIEASTGNTRSTAALLHQFHCYLETLLGQVRMRSVFGDVGEQKISTPLDNSYLTGAPIGMDDAALTGCSPFVDLDKGGARTFEPSGVAVFDLAIAALA
ncbi:MAG TPA: hypothetical protein VJ124_17880 [Pyrinomonadaceae bacterium]|nr:hypothetical protein [Pyrinomonadaceae bacterium]